MPERKLMEERIDSSRHVNRHVNQSRESGECSLRHGCSYTVQSCDNMILLGKLPFTFTQRAYAHDENFN